MLIFFLRESYMSVNERFIKYLEVEKTKHNKFCNEINYSAPVFSNFITGKTKLANLELIIKTMKHRPQWNIRWLLLGEGSMYHDSEKMVVVKEDPPEYAGDSALIKSLVEQLQYMRDELKKKDELIDKLQAELAQLRKIDK